MRAMFLHGPKDLRLGEMPKPVPGPGEALVRVKTVGICGSDQHNYLFGEIGGVFLKEPLVIGHEVSGVVEALGPGVEGPAVGTPVAVDPSISCGHCQYCLEGYPNLCPQNRFFGGPPVHGGLCEYLTHPAELLFPLPAGMSYDEGALLEPMGVALYVAGLADVRLGDRVAVLGCGPIGLMTIQMLRLSGAVEILATDVVPERLQAAQRLGADWVCHAGEQDAVRAIKEHTGGRGVDVVIEAAGVLETVPQAVEAVRPGGTVVIVGIPPEDRISFVVSTARRKGLTIKFDRRMAHTYPRSIDLVASGRVNIRPLATHHFPLERTAEAIELVLARRDGVLKAMIEV